MIAPQLVFEAWHARAPSDLTLYVRVEDVWIGGKHYPSAVYDVSDEDSFESRPDGLFICDAEPARGGLTMIPWVHITDVAYGDGTVINWLTLYARENEAHSRRGRLTVIKGEKES